MATFLSTPDSSTTQATPGERRFAARLRQFLEDDYLCWYDVPVGPKHRHPDFLILHPGRGLLVLEIKDWTLDTIFKADPEHFTLATGAGHKVVGSPLKQVRQFAHAVVDLLKVDPQLTHPPDSACAGQLTFPYGYGVVLTGITRHQFNTSGLGDILQPHLVICKDEMTESADAEAFQKRLWDMFNVRFQAKLTLPQVERIRWILFPEIRIHQQLLPMEADDQASVTAAPSDLLQVMDLAQEEIARNLGEGHRVIHGVAGSGKTLILAYRCQFLARTLTKPILVLVFNKALAAWLQFQMAQRGLSQNVTVRHFHGWCMDQLRHYHVPSPSQGPDFVAKLVEAVIRGVDRNQIPRAQYGAVLIDEGHDFEPDWLRLVVQMLDPESNSLLLLYDDAQSIYQHQRERFTFRSVGISAMGRTKILKRNYRNTDEILACASAFAGALLQEVQADDDTVPLVSPEPGGRKGPKPVFRELRSMQDEADSIAREIGKRRKAGVAFSDIGVFYTAPFVATEVMASLTRAGIPFEWLKDPNAKAWQPGHDSVKLMTIHSSKGLQYQVGIIAGAGCLPWRSPTEDARLMYVAMTRATHELLITGSKRTVFTERLREICEVQAA